MVSAGAVRTLSVTSRAGWMLLLRASQPSSHVQLLLLLLLPLLLMLLASLLAGLVLLLV